MIDFPRYFLRKRSTDWEQTGRSLMMTSGEEIYVFRLDFTGDQMKVVLVFIYVKLFDVLLTGSSTYLIGARLFAFLASFNFFQHYCRSSPSALFSAFSFQSQFLNSLFDFSNYLTVPMHSMILLAYSWLEALLSSSSLSIDLKLSICSKAISSSFFNCSFSCLSCMISLAFRSILILTWFLIRPALTAYWRVDRVSQMQSQCGFRQAMRYVRQLPPKAFLRIEVSLASRQGTYCYFPLFALSYKERITFLRKNKDLLIYMASLLSLPTGLKTLSEPARSTKYARRTLQFFSQSSSSMLTVKMVCDRLEKS